MMSSNLPLVSIAIITFNRLMSLIESLRVILNQDYKNIEIIVVDNNSTDGTADYVNNNYPQVKLIKLSKNIGISSWNEAFKISKGEYIMVLDDDSYPLNGTILKGVEEMINNTEIGIIAFNVINLKFYFSESAGIEKNPILFVGCGALIRKNLFVKIGYFNELIFIYFHEIDFSIRCLNSGYKINYLPEAIVVHDQNLINRKQKYFNPFTSRFRFYYNFLSYSIYLILYFDLKYSIKYFIKYVVSRFIIALHYHYYKEFSKGILIVLLSLKNYYAKRNKVKIEIQKLFDYGNTPLIDRVFLKNKYIYRFIKNERKKYNKNLY